MSIVKSRGFYSGLKYQLIASMTSYIDANTIPSVAYNDPEITWIGITEEQARAEDAEGTVTDIYVPKR